MTTNTSKTLVTPEMAEDIRQDFRRYIEFWENEFFQSKGYDETALENLGVSAFDLESSGFSVRSAETDSMKSKRETLELLLSVFERGVASEEFYLEDELEFYTLNIRQMQRKASEYQSIILGYEVAHEILWSYLS